MNQRSRHVRDSELSIELSRTSIADNNSESLSIAAFDTLFSCPFMQGVEILASQQELPAALEEDCLAATAVAGEH